MKNKKSFSVIGGDLRQVKMANGLAQDGYDVKAFGFNNIEFHPSIIQVNSIQEAIDGADVIIAPLPCTLDNETVNAPFYDEKIFYKDLFKKISKNQLFVGGKLGEKINNLAKVYNIYVVDYFEREELTVLNAIPTAEGAIQIAMEEMPITIHSSNCLILGYGRIGRILSKMLWGLGANVTVEARKYEDLAWIKSFGYNGIHLNELTTVIGDYDVIFNTIPSVVLDTDILSKIDKECLVIDLASKPGGVDFEMARNIGIKTIWALSLPGKVAPNTAGDIIKDTIFNIIYELGV
ncbi:dipicolinate synthase subunit DpsA [Petroclostridium sp. X23]|uniref:dipicolinate synthase subunit DpsA n=1 Tax=Petroclostridium sp. X23 TaxID=3045146 RepID=UPI0024AE3CA8|nr:dipicolinate synthase subunit DpsA [Petroclostridium sp. X23]WHH58988.1 dipicolinate synthase subunit DpsA [Petroclostridium sp. X23]